MIQKIVDKLLTLGYVDLGFDKMRLLQALFKIDNTLTYKVTIDHISIQFEYSVQLADPLIVAILEVPLTEFNLSSEELFDELFDKIDYRLKSTINVELNKREGIKYPDNI